MIKDGERLDDLEYGNLYIIQHPNGYCFTSDSVLLANQIKIARGGRAVDLGTGSGVIAILLTGKTDVGKVYGVELQERLADMAKRSVEYNGLCDRVEIVQAQMQGVEKIIGDGFDVVVSNPPYEKCVKKDGYTEEEICRQECHVTLEEVVKTAARLLKFGGDFYIINKAKRLAEMIFLLKENKLEPKRILAVQPKADRAVDTVIITARKGGKPGVALPKPLVVYNADGSMTSEARSLYGK